MRVLVHIWNAAEQIWYLPKLLFTQSTCFILSEVFQILKEKVFGK